MQQKETQVGEKKQNLSLICYVLILDVWWGLGLERCDLDFHLINPPLFQVENYS